MTEKSKQTNVRLDPDTRRILDKAAKATGIPAGGLMRILIRTFAPFVVTKLRERMDDVELKGVEEEIDKRKT